MLLHGIFPPITTPYNLQGEVYFQKLEQNVARYSKAPIAGIVALGSTGEAILLSDRERRDVLKCVRGSATPEKVLIAGTGVESAVETLRLTEYAAELGYDVALVRTPHFYRSQLCPENMLAFYRFVADRSPLPVLIYNFPQATGYDIPVEVVVQLAEHPNLIGIKESCASPDKVRQLAEGTGTVRRLVRVTDTFQALTSRMSRFAAKHAGNDVLPMAASSAVAVENGIRTREKEVGFQVLVGSGQQFFELLQAGAVGGVIAFADAAPTAMYEVYSAWREGDLTLAMEKQQRVTTAAARIAGDLGIPGVKYACDLNGYCGGPVRLPLMPLTAALKAEVERLMAGIRN